MESTIEFQSWPKISRVNKVFNQCVVTEKLDGTNAQILIQDGKIVAIGSRNRFITPEDDNFGFASWVMKNEEEILKLGEGRHYGEWYGSGIQRNYGLKERRFSLFNPYKYKDRETFPDCCEVTKIIYKGPFGLDLALEDPWDLENVKEESNA